MKRHEIFAGLNGYIDGHEFKLQTGLKYNMVGGRDELSRLGSDDGSQGKLVVAMGTIYGTSRLGDAWKVRRSLESRARR